MKIRGNLVGTTQKPERVLIKATDFTEEQKLQIRENLGVTDGSGSVDPTEVEKIVEEYLTENPPTPGKDGKDGEDGADGYTPQKGIDYWTAEDKTEMVNDVLAALPTYNGEVEEV